MIRDTMKELQNLRDKCDELAQRFADPYSGIPSGLRVEFIREPGYTKIVDSLPEFSWFVPEEAVIQKAYQILVSSSKELAEKNIGDVWNSGQVRSSKSLDIEFEGEALKPNSTYYWRVRIFDQDKRLSEYSEVQEFRTGSFGKNITTHNCFQVERIPPIAFKKSKRWKLFC